MWLQRPPISPLRTGIEDVGVRFAAQPDPSESSEGHLLDLGAVVIEATPIIQPHGFELGPASQLPRFVN